MALSPQNDLALMPIEVVLVLVLLALMLSYVISSVIAPVLQRESPAEALFALWVGGGLGFSVFLIALGVYLILTGS